MDRASRREPTQIPSRILGRARGQLLFAIALGLGVTAAMVGAAFASVHHVKRHQVKGHRQRHHMLVVRHAHRTAVPFHIPTWAFDDGCSGGSGASGPLVRRWLSYAEVNCGVIDQKAQSDCHPGGKVACKVMQYFDTDWIYPADHVLNATSAAVAHWWQTEPAPNQATRVFTQTLDGAYLVNQTLPSVQAYFRKYARAHYNEDDGLLMDWQSPGLSQELYYSSCSCRTTAQIHTDAQLRAAHADMARAMTHRNGGLFMQADNTLPGNPFLPQGMNMLNRRNGVVAWTVEGEPMSDGTMMSYYSTLLDQIAYIGTRTRGFIAPMSRAPANAPYLAQTRRIQEGTMLLGFRPGHLVDWADLEQGSNRLSVWPEVGLYPTRPLESMDRPGGAGCLAGTGQVCSRGGHTSIRVAPGIYRREFAACYLTRQPVGPCGAIVNDTGNYVTVRGSWLRLVYGHQVTFNGGDVESGGTVNMAGVPFVAGTSFIAPHDAILLAQ